MLKDESSAARNRNPGRWSRFDFDNRTAIDRGQHAPWSAHTHANVRRESLNLVTRLRATSDVWCMHVGAREAAATLIQMTGS
jgi:hypothetical protein